MAVEQFAIAISLLALVISSLSLWVNSLRPFNLRVSHDAPSFRLYRITPKISGSEDGKNWWIPSFDMGLSFYNLGRQPGEVLDVRIVCELRSHQTIRKFSFYPRWIVDYSQFQRSGSERFEWLDSAVLRDWYPFTLGASSEKDIHVVLEADRWDYKENGEMTLSLEIISLPGSKWRRLASYKLRVSEDMFEGKSSYSPYDEKIERLRKEEA